jgi:hypothetical protein
MLKADGTYKFHDERLNQLDLFRLTPKKTTLFFHKMQIPLRINLSAYTKSISKLRIFPAG